MKILALLVTFLSSYNAFAADETILSCRLTKLFDTSYFEESLSLEEYPEIEVIKNTRKGLRISIGSSLYQDEEDGWTISVEPNAIGGRVYEVVNKKQKTTISLVIEGVWGRESGTINVTEKGEDLQVGRFTCF